MIVKTGGRYDSLIRLCKSVWNYYPNLKTIIIDDFKNKSGNDFKLFLTKHKEYLEYYSMNFEAGISKGRNRALSFVKTKLFLLVDDDFKFTKLTKLEKLVSVILSTDAIIAGGEHPFKGIGYCDYYGIFLTTCTKNSRKLHIINGRVHEAVKDFESCYRVDFTKNLFIGRTKDVLKLKGWSEPILVHEHIEFFLRLVYAKKKVVWCFDILADHCQTDDVVRKQRENIEKNCKEKWLKNHFFTDSIYERGTITTF